MVQLENHKCYAFIFPTKNPHKITDSIDTFTKYVQSINTVSPTYKFDFIGYVLYKFRNSNQFTIHKIDYIGRIFDQNKLNIYHRMGDNESKQIYRDLLVDFNKIYIYHKPTMFNKKPDIFKKYENIGIPSPIGQKGGMNETIYLMKTPTEYFKLNFKYRNQKSPIVEMEVQIGTSPHEFTLTDLYPGKMENKFYLINETNILPIFNIDIDFKGLLTHLDSVIIINDSQTLIDKTTIFLRDILAHLKQINLHIIKNLEHTEKQLVEQMRKSARNQQYLTQLGKIKTTKQLIQTIERKINELESVAGRIGFRKEKELNNIILQLENKTRRLDSDKLLVAYGTIDRELDRIIQSSTESSA